MKAHRGDEVYFHKGGEPCCGKVLAAGKHGCTIECDGQQHRVKWHNISGHKKRVPLEYRVLDHGEDGMIVQDQNGRRRYFGVPAHARAERLELEGGHRPARIKGQAVDRSDNS